MTEIDINGQKYRIGKLDAMRQFHLSRKIAPIIPTLIPVFVKLSKGGSLTDDLGGFAELLAPFAEGISTMSDEASEYVISTCMSVVSRQSGSAFASAWNKQANTTQFDDMDLAVILQLVIRVVQASLGPFIYGILTSQQGSE